MDRDGFSVICGIGLLLVSVAHLGGDGTSGVPMPSWFARSCGRSSRHPASVGNLGWRRIIESRFSPRSLAPRLGLDHCLLKILKVSDLLLMTATSITVEVPML